MIPTGPRGWASRLRRLLWVASVCAGAAACASPGAGATTPSPITEEPTVTDETAGECTPTLNAAGLPNRSERAIAADRGRLRMYAHYLAGTSARGRSERVPGIDYGDLKEALADDDVDERAQAAFIAGRCRAGTDARDAKLTKRLAKIAGKKKVTAATVEAGMALALRGERDAGVKALARGLKGDDEAAPWRAAGYLAQLGDASGWSVLAGMATHADAEIRVGALEAALDFLGLESAPDVHGLIAAAKDDGESEVRQALPRLLRLAEHPDAVAITTRLAEEDPDETVRLMARHELGPPR